MLMLTGVMGESMTQKQAEALELGQPFAYGNQRRTMSDLRQVGDAHLLRPRRRMEGIAEEHQAAQ